MNWRTFGLFVGKQFNPFFYPSIHPSIPSHLFINSKFEKALAIVNRIRFSTCSTFEKYTRFLFSYNFQLIFFLILFVCVCVCAYNCKELFVDCLYHRWKVAKNKEKRKSVFSRTLSHTYTHTHPCVCEINYFLSNACRHPLILYVIVCTDALICDDGTQESFMTTFFFVTLLLSLSLSPAYANNNTDLWLVTCCLSKEIYFFQSNWFH